MSLKNKIKELIPKKILLPLQRIHYHLGNRKRIKDEARMIAEQPELHRKAVERIRLKRGPINVVFFATFDSTWKYDIIYRMMAKDDRFNPVILICPVVNYGKDNMLMNMDRCYNLFKSRGYNVIRSYNADTGIYVDARKELNPDIIFYTNPYKGLIDDRYYITNFRNILTVYVSYGYPNSSDQKLNYGELLHSLVWRRYVENRDELTQSIKSSKINGINIRYTGFPGTDCFINNCLTPNDVWKIKDRKVKRIIWAPHHTISNYVSVCYSTFLTYYDFMLEMAHKYKDKIQIAFKPHPLLKNRLNILWGEDETKKYYNKWERLSNGLLSDGAYEDLFMSSDAIIHDSGSFVAEYLFVNKPALFLKNELKIEDQYNTFGKKCLNQYYLAYSKEDIEQFIINLIDGKDPKKQKRRDFVKNELMPPNGKLASENIIDDIVKELIPETK